MKSLPACFLALLASVARADTSEALSDIFAFETRDSAGTIEAASGVFAFDARDLGNVASSSSSVFALGTQSGTLSAVTIGAGAPSSVVAGQSYAFPAQATFSGSGVPTEVSTSAAWFIVGAAPADTRFEGNKLVGGDVTVPTVIRVSA